MGKMNIVIKDETEERLRRAISQYKGLKKGNISIAIEEAIDLWIDYMARASQETSPKAVIGWT